MEDFEEGVDVPCEAQPFTDDANAMKNIGMDEVSPEGLTYHVNTMELEVERYIDEPTANSSNFYFIH
jgi:hypothetical protein